MQFLVDFQLVRLLHTQRLFKFKAAEFCRSLGCGSYFSSAHPGENFHACGRKMSAQHQSLITPGGPCRAGTPPPLDALGPTQPSAPLRPHGLWGKEAEHQAASRPLSLPAVSLSVEVSGAELSRAHLGVCC